MILYLNPLEMWISIQEKFTYDYAISFAQSIQSNSMVNLIVPKEEQKKVNKEIFSLTQIRSNLIKFNKRQHLIHCSYLNIWRCGDLHWRV